jgi:hypothetical protein
MIGHTTGMHRWGILALVMCFGASCSDQTSGSKASNDADVQGRVARSSVDAVPPMTPEAAATQLVLAVRSSKTTTCTPLTGFRSTRLCVFSDLVTMEHALTRAAFYIERRPGFFLTDRAISEESGVLGFDLESAALTPFYKNWQTRLSVLADATTPEHRAALKHETDFWRDYVTANVLPDSNAVLLAIASDGYQASTFDHELVHAAFFETPAIDGAVQEFLAKEVTLADFAAIREVLKPFYALTDARLIRNEFAAYMLMSGAKNATLGEFIDKYAERLRSYLRAEGITIAGHAGPLLWEKQRPGECRGAVPNCRGSRETGVILNPFRVKDPQAPSRPVCTSGPLQAGAFRQEPSGRSLQAGAFRVTHEEHKTPMSRFIPDNLELHPECRGMLQR